MTDIGEHEMSHEKLIRFYRQRGQTENYLKEMKYGFDPKHYPCQELVANKAYASICGFSANILRFLSLHHLTTREKKKKAKPRYSKLARFAWIHLPCQVVRHARQVTLRFHNTIYREVDYWLKTIKTLQLEYT